MRNEKLEALKKEILSMDVKSDDFWDVVCLVNEKYYTIENPDDYQLSAKTMIMWLMKSVNAWEDHVIVAQKIITELFMMKHKEHKSCTGTIGFDDATYYFDIYTSEVEKDKLNKTIFDIGRKVENGDFKVKNKYFNKKK